MKANNREKEREPSKPCYSYSTKASDDSLNDRTWFLRFWGRVSLASICCSKISLHIPKTIMTVSLTYVKWAFRQIGIPVGVYDIWKDIKHSHSDVCPSLSIKVLFQQWIQFAEPQWTGRNNGSCQVVHQTQNWCLL